MAECSSTNPDNVYIAIQLAVLQAWYGRDEDFAATRRRIFANAMGTEDAGLADWAAKVASLLPSADGPDLDAAVSFGRRAVELGKGNPLLDDFLMSLGMAEYRKGHFAEALAALDESKANRKDHPEAGGKLTHALDGTTPFFRAMSLFRLGKVDEARTLATEVASKVKPPPADGQYPLADGADLFDLILWLAYKEARALIGFDPPPAAPAKPAAQ